MIIQRHALYCVIFCWRQYEHFANANRYQSVKYYINKT